MKKSNPYISIIKPGIIMGNIITLCAGYALAMQGWQNFNLRLFIATTLGMILIIACGCVLNNCIDQDIDKCMKRTQNRVMALGEWPLTKALTYALLLGLLGSMVFYQYTNILTLMTAIFGLFVYVIIYSLIMKRHSIYGTLVGGIAGAIPPIVGYTTLRGQIDAPAINLFFILLFWQIPHSYAIAIYRLKDYKAASIPVLPVTDGIPRTKIHMLFYTCLYAIAMITLTYTAKLGIFYLCITSIMSVYWVTKSIQGFTLTTSTDVSDTPDTSWARKIFFMSIIQITLLSALIILCANF